MGNASARAQHACSTVRSQSSVITLPRAVTKRVRQSPGRRPKGLLSLCDVRKRKEFHELSPEMGLAMLAKEARKARGAKVNPFQPGSPEASLFEMFRDCVKPNPIPSYAVDLLMAAKRLARSRADSTAELLAQYQYDLESAVIAFEAAMPVVDGVIAEYGRGA